LLAIYASERYSLLDVFDASERLSSGLLQGALVSMLGTQRDDMACTKNPVHLGCCDGVQNVWLWLVSILCIWYRSSRPVSP
jgi:hypothetical protein